MRYRAIAVAAVALLPVVLLWSSLRIWRDLDGQRVVYLRSRAAALAGRLETLPPEATAADLDDPALQQLTVLRAGQSSDGEDLTALWEGRELFRTAFSADGTTFRAWIPFHSGDELHIARLDIAASAASFLTGHASHNLLLAVLTGLALLGLAVYAAVAESRRIELERMAEIGRMSAALAHEIRNPLGAIKGFAQLIEERAGAADKPLSQSIVSESIRLERLVNDLLLYGRPQQPRPRACSWPELALLLTAQVEPIAGARGVRLSVADPALPLTTDPDLLLQVLANLLRNAAEAARSAAALEVSGNRFIITDDGPGFTPAALASLYRPFVTTKAAGTGLGLAISRKLAGALGATLAIGNQPAGGARAILTLHGKLTRS
jgi:signal transduction histidine kinase